MGAPFERVVRFAVRHGVTVRVVGDVPAEAQAPFLRTVGLSWPRFILYVERGQERGAETLGGMVHELGHLLGTTERPDAAHELRFAGWEWRAAHACGVQRQWLAHMYNYTTDEGDEFARLDTQGRRSFLRRMVVLGRKHGNVSPSGRPIALRGPRAERP